MHILNENYSPEMNAEAIANRLRTFAHTIAIWERKRDHAAEMLDDFTRAREAFIAHIPELPVWLSERGEIGADAD